jgi:predicted metal-dependent hydrolase
MKIETFLLETPDRNIPIQLQYGFRKRLSLTVYPDRRVIARIPYGFSRKKTLDYFHKKAPWILKHLEHFEQHPPENEKLYIDGETHQYLGREFVLKLEQGPTKVTLSEETLMLRVRDINDNDMKKKAMNAWLRKEAIRVLTPLFDEWMKRLQYLVLPDASFRFYKMIRRWGSCSSKHVITLNTELIKKEKALIDYVIVHEICHLKIPAHNKKFYALVGSIMPDWKERRSALNNG